MFTINDDNSIYATRGDIVFFSVSAEDDGVPHYFEPGDVLRIKVYGRKDAETVVLQKDFPVLANAEEVEIYLTEDDTKIGEMINKPTDYWYEVELNPETAPQTIIGYGEDGAAVFKLFPEGGDAEIDEHVPTEEDIPFVDSELDLTSPRPVENRVIAAAIEKIRGDIADVLPKMISAPTSGTWARGDIVFNREPAGGGPVGWVCVSAGTPGEWHSFGTVAAV